MPGTLHPVRDRARNASRWAGRVRGFAGMPLAEKALLPVAFLVMAFAALALRLIPFRLLAPVLGTPIGAVGCIPLTTASQLRRARMVRRAIRRAAQLAPFRSDCLPQALAAATLCRALGAPAAVHLGMRRDVFATELAAHAWVCSGPAVVAGGASFESYVPVACFLPARLALRA